MAKKNIKEKEGTSPVAVEEKAVKKTAKNSKKWYQTPFVSGIIGVGKLFAVASIVYSDAIIVLGTGDDIMPKIMLIPQTLLAAFILIKQFIKQ